MKSTREITAEYRLSHWAQVMAKRTQSGLSIKRYCKENGICSNTYFYWQRKLREAAVKELALEPVKTTMPVPSGWTQVSTADNVQNTESTGVTIEIGKCRITANEATDTELLAKVCKALVNIC